MRLMVYSHDGFGLGNIRRMLAICTYLLRSIPELSILMVSGSPMLHSFRLPQGLDYIKLPCLNRGTSGELSAKYLGTETQETVQLRSQLILSAIASFKPDVFLVDKKPYGMQNELQASMEYLRAELPDTQIVLLLRDILDHPDATIQDWQKHGYYEAIQIFYDRVLVVGSADVFDICQEYQIPPAIVNKVQFCGYIRKEPGNRHPTQVRQALSLQPGEKLVLVTPGGGEDGYHLIHTYLSSLSHQPSGLKLRSLIICGPEMPLEQQAALVETASSFPHVQISEFTDDLMSYMVAADGVVAMGGYNTTCEILSAGKRAVIVPRVKPSQEQWLRAERLAKLGVLVAIHPDQLTPQGLMRSLVQQLNALKPTGSSAEIDLCALPRIAQYIRTMLAQKGHSMAKSPLLPLQPVPKLGNSNSWLKGWLSVSTKSPTF
ncbi:glycosyltransferase [Leptothermofonsia sichuanensis E412]|uniref:glycosyltransferase family protein n=1 Tax=Leptothermofonsia sichuanensis TaxID=2917832 RepID=UPI001CA60589|nr:glycosyltransferase [Leptothermofonsia sichuanensis]QZZ19693.1 glycosyltransferase [Leptothermofonsia sichuanensis E412]